MLFFLLIGLFIIQHMFYGLHEKIGETTDNKADIIRKHLESRFDVCIVYDIYFVLNC